MIAPELWSDLLPTKIDPTTSASSMSPISTMPSSLASFFPPPPSQDQPVTQQLHPISLTATEESLQIHSAVVGVTDITGILQKKIKDNKLSFQASAIGEFIAGKPQPPVNGWLYLTCIYQYGKQPMRLCIAKFETTATGGSTDTTTTYAITKDNNEFAIVNPTAWSEDTWSIVAFVYGAKQYTAPDIIQKLQDTIRRNNNGGLGARWSDLFTNDFFGEDPWVGRLKTALIFYRVMDQGAVRCTVGFESTSRCLLTDDLSRPQPDFSQMGMTAPGLNNTQFKGEYRCRILRPALTLHLQFRG